MASLQANRRQKRRLMRYYRQQAAPTMSTARGMEVAKSESGYGFPGKREKVRDNTKMIPITHKLKTADFRKTDYSGLSQGPTILTSEGRSDLSSSGYFDRKRSMAKRRKGLKTSANLVE